jgi:lipopolysaccharide assembly protein A
MKRVFYILVGVVSLFVGITFAFQNSQNVELKYYFDMTWSGPLSLVLFSVCALGVAVGYVAGLRMVVRMQRQLVQARKEVRQIEQEVTNLRALPIKDVV